MAKAKERIDTLLVEQGLAPSREKAKAAIMAGLVSVDGQRVDKPGTEVPLSAVLVLQGPACPYVSRGGLKLAKALKTFPITLTEKVVLDVGASTGGFTDCALQNGAAKVFAVDVGYGQLAWSLRSDPRVVSMERTNARYLTPEQLGEQVDFVTIDVAFISLDKILPAIKGLIKPMGQVMALIKPQFEAGKDKVGKKGVVKDPLVHREVIIKVLSMAEQVGYTVKGLSYSPVKGPEGNIEYLAWLAVGKEDSAESWALRMVEVVEQAHSSLD
ncbi:MAG TPA: TlyA family RNA methyltransferase [Candidatus Deferrimicrobium sp.]|nr:TlyA family RNA methyltransferase [Candidatus Deferrimicrobium sp.]